MIYKHYLYEFVALYLDFSESGSDLSLLYRKSNVCMRSSSTNGDVVSPGIYENSISYEDNIKTGRIVMLFSKILKGQTKQKSCLE